MLLQARRLVLPQRMQLRAVEQGDREAARLVAVPVEALSEAVPEAPGALADLADLGGLLVQARQVVAILAPRLLVPAKVVAVRVRYLPVARGLVQLVRPAVKVRVFAQPTRALAVVRLAQERVVPQQEREARAAPP